MILILGIIIFIFLCMIKDNPRIDIYVISLKKCLNRRDLMQKHLKKINFKFFDAIDGRNMNENEKEYSEKLFENNLSLGEKGCFLSHLALWEKIVNSGNKYTLILEDDAIINSDYLNDKKLQTLLQQLIEKTKDFDFMYIGHLMEIPGILINSYNENITIHNTVSARGLHGYLISLEGAKKLIGFSGIKYKKAVDEIILDNNSVKKVSIFPSLITQNPRIGSVIGPERWHG